jgi:pimeloyl-ACP methyl ester carboxylesterase
VTPATQLVASARVSHLFVEVAGARIHLLDFGGSGRPVILLHGVLGQAWMWHDAAPGLAAHGRVLALDFRGYGDSQWGGEGYSTDGHADDVEAVIEALGAEEVDLVGFSWGGLVALALAARRPELVRRLAMVDIPPSSTQSETELPPLTGAYADHADAVESERRLSPRADEEMLSVMAAFGTRAAPGGGLTRKLDPFFLERWPFRGDNRWDELRALKQRLLVVHALQSQVLSGDDAARMREEAHDASLVEIDDCGHLIPVERPAQLSAALADFLGAS